MSNSVRSPSPCVMVILGATGDLTRRKLIPSLAALKRDGLLPERFAVVGFARRDKSDEEFRDDLRQGVEEHGSDDTAESFTALADSIHYHRSTFEDSDGYRTLAERLDQTDKQVGTAGNRIFYLATPPSAYSGILDNLKTSGLSQETYGRFSRVIVEKPFGRDLESAQALNAQVGAAFDEDQVFRIDHYLGKETVQNILAMRFANRIFEPLWNSSHVDHVQVTVAESIGVAGRGDYFEESGVIRDMIQNHLLQVLTLIAMEPPYALTATAVRNEKVKVLRAIRSFEPDEVPKNTVRGQYDGYLQEDGVASASTTETFAAVRLEVNNWRWSKTPFFLRSGKHLPKRVTEVAIYFRRPPHHLFGANRLNRNILLITIQPDEGIDFRFGCKVPGPDVKIRDVEMEMLYREEFACKTADAYQRLLLDAMLGDSTLFARRDEVEEAWRIVDSIAAGWHDYPPLPYAPGTWGPPEADRLLRNQRRWRIPE